VASWSEGFEGGTPGATITTANTGLTTVVSGTDGRPVFVATPTRAGSLAAGAEAVTGDVVADFLYAHPTTLTRVNVAASIYLDPVPGDPEPGLSLADFAIGGDTGGVALNFDRAPTLDLDITDGGELVRTRTVPAPAGEWIDVAISLADLELVVEVSGTVTGAVVTETVTVSPAWSFSLLLASVFNVDGSRSYLDALAVAETSIVVPPVTRLYPRDDGRGLSSAPRRYPLPRSSRRVGGYT
jgi:hypothetical protein